MKRYDTMTLIGLVLFMFFFSGCGGVEVEERETITFKVFRQLYSISDCKDEEVLDWEDLPKHIGCQQDYLFKYFYQPDFLLSLS